MGDTAPESPEIERSGRRALTPRRFWRAVLGCLAAALVSILICGYSHKRSWIPSDDGHYAHVADRLLDGEVLNRDVEELHPGYIHFIHAIAFQVFGRDMLSLRYPLLFITAIQACLVFLIFQSRGFWAGIVASLCLSAFGFPQIANPTTSLYAGFLTVLVLAGLVLLRPTCRRRLEILGFLTMLVFLFRQLTGVFVAMGLMTYLLIEASGDAKGGSKIAARAMIALMFVGIAGYLVKATDALGFILFGVWPLAALFWSWRRVSLSGIGLMRVMGRLLLGALMAVAPLIIYHWRYGSLDAWFNDCFIRSVRVTRLEHIHWSNYGFFLLGGLQNLFRGPDAVARLNGVYWTALPLLSALNGFLLLRGLIASGRGVGTNVSVPVIAVFHALVSVFNQIPFYLYLSVGLSAAGVLWLMPQSRRWVLCSSIAAAMLCMTGVVFHAGQPSTRSFTEVVSGTRIALVPSDLERNGLWIDGDELELYHNLIRLIQEETPPDGSIFVAPNNAELYFLSGRKNPLDIFNTTLGAMTESETQDLATSLIDKAPLLLIHNTACKYNTPLTKMLIESLSGHSERVARVEHFDIFRVSNKMLSNAHEFDNTSSQ